MARIDSAAPQQGAHRPMMAEDELRARRAWGFGGCFAAFLVACGVAVFAALFLTARFLPATPEDAALDLSATDPFMNEPTLSDL